MLRKAAATLGLELDGPGPTQLARDLDAVRLTTIASSDSTLLHTLATRYALLLQQAGMLDYTAMLTLPHHLFAARPDLLQSLQTMYRHILIDEYQDVSSQQYTLARSLASQHRNLVGVGDTAQTIYPWRGANPRFLTDFQHDFPGTQVLRLTQNFRSTGRIVTLANALGGALLDQRLWTSNPPGVFPRLVALLDPKREAAFVAAEIARLRATNTIQESSEVAVLYRTNQQAEPVIQALHALGFRTSLDRRRSEPAQPPPHNAPVRSELDETDQFDPDEPARLNAFLDAQDAESDAGSAVESGGVELSTIHRAKGREWPVVFVVGCEDGLLPYIGRAGLAPDDEYAERCVAYVAVTRPRIRLYLTYCQTRSRAARTLSRFLCDLPASLLEHTR
jgi:superfamily I DNA/RNA helicase